MLCLHFLYSRAFLVCIKVWQHLWLVLHQYLPSASGDSIWEKSCNSKILMMIQRKSDTTSKNWNLFFKLFVMKENVGCKSLQLHSTVKHDYVFSSCLLEVSDMTSQEILLDSHAVWLDEFLIGVITQILLEYGCVF